MVGLYVGIAVGIAVIVGLVWLLSQPWEYSGVPADEGKDQYDDGVIL